MTASKDCLDRVSVIANPKVSSKADAGLSLWHHLVRPGTGSCNVLEKPIVGVCDPFAQIDLWRPTHRA